MLAGGLLGLPAGAAAQQLTDNRYAIDVFQGPILAPIRVTGIAGAYAANAEGISGMVSNAAAPAVREAYSVNFLEADIAASISIPLSIFERNDFDNSGTTDYEYSDFIYATFGGLIQVGALGLGAIGEFQRYSLTEAGPNASGRRASTNITLGKYHVLAAWRLLGDQLMIGAGVRIATLGIDAPDANLTHAGAAVETGMLVRPDWEPFRFGATFRFPVEASLFGNGMEDENGVARVGGLVLPDRVVLPWELELGLAIQVGPRPLNPIWIDPHDAEGEVERSLEARREARRAARAAELWRIADPAAREEQRRAFEDLTAREAEEDEAALKRAARAAKKQRRKRYWSWPREHLLVTAELLVTGPVNLGVSLERFLGQNQEPYEGQGPAVGTSGRSVNFSPRFGIETEPILNLVQTRLGSYYEPSRFGASVGRQHFTFGADLRVGPTTWWGLVPEVIYKLQASLDVAPRYQSASFGVGVWH